MQPLGKDLKGQAEELANGEPLQVLEKGVYERNHLTANRTFDCKLLPRKTYWITVGNYISSRKGDSGTIWECLTTQDKRRLGLSNGLMTFSP